MLAKSTLDRVHGVASYRANISSGSASKRSLYPAWTSESRNSKPEVVSLPPRQTLRTAELIRRDYPRGIVLGVRGNRSQTMGICESGPQSSGFRQYLIIVSRL